MLYFDCITNTLNISKHLKKQFRISGRVGMESKMRKKIDMIRLCYCCCFHNFNFRSLTCHINKVSNNTTTCFQTNFLCKITLSGYVWILLFALKTRFVQNRVSHFHSPQKLLPKCIGIINYKINCENVENGTNDDVVLDVVKVFGKSFSTFFR